MTPSKSIHPCITSPFYRNKLLTVYTQKEELVKFYQIFYHWSTQLAASMAITVNSPGSSSSSLAKSRT